MAQILVRQLATEAHHALKARAQKQNRSAESVAREILECSLVPKASLGFGDQLTAVWDGADLSGVVFDAAKTPYDPVDLK